MRLTVVLRVVSYNCAVEVLVSEVAEEHIRAHGGAVFIRAHPHRCCHGSLTLLDTTTDPPNDLAYFESVEAGGVEVWFCGGSSGRPDQLVIELGGVLKRHPVAYWDGCALKP
jgi:hypothetical protein